MFQVLGSLPVKTVLKGSDRIPRSTLRVRVRVRVRLAESRKHSIGRKCSNCFLSSVRP